mmetsp:Transcript_91510/g.247300  ORF Transcript_91510/g.247300 Transcript_91510/m.247300 type:complete len:155 (-) Transcript_91510:169-633(-)
MGKRSRSSNSASSSSSSSSSEEKKKEKKDKKNKEKKKKEKKDKKKHDKKDKKKDKKKSDKKEKDKQQAKATPPEARLVTCGPGARSDAFGLRGEREKLLREAVAAGAKIALPGNMPEVKDKSRLDQAKAALERLQASQQKREAKVGYTVGKPNW